MQRKYIFQFGTAAAIFGIAITGGSAKAVTIAPNNSAIDLGDKVFGNSSHITVNSVTYNGADGASGIFTNGESSIGLDSGIALTSGQADDAEGPNNSEGTSTVNGFSGDPDLNSLVSPSDTQDVTSLEFEFDSTGGNVSFDYVFGSEEYTEWVDSQFNDVFGIFLNGQNIATVPNTSTPVSVNNVNSSSNADYFNDNDPSQGNTNLEYDGFTDVLNAQASVAPGTHTLKMAIADNGDSILDSGVFVKEDVPESSSLLGLLAVSVLGAGTVLVRKQA